MSFVVNANRTVQSVFGMSAKKNDIGIEIEMEGTGPLGVQVKGWDNHEEGSLRAPGGEGRGGIEYVTHGPVAFEIICQAVDRLASELKNNGCIVDLNAHRTSTHLHLNVQQLRLIEVLGYLTVFTAVEPLFLNLCGDDRDGNAFCLSSHETGDLPDYFKNICASIERLRDGVGFESYHQRGKYASLSTFRLHDLGTVECRCFPVSLDGKQITEWAQWLINIKNIVLNETDMSFRQIIKLGIHEPLVLAERVFGFIPHSRVPQGLQQELIMYGSQEAYELTRLLKKYLNKKPDEKRKYSLKDGMIIDDLIEDIPMALTTVAIPQPRLAPQVWGMPPRTNPPAVEGFGQRVRRNAR